MERMIYRLKGNEAKYVLKRFILILKYLYHEISDLVYCLPLPDIQ
jgi:hypothetical protein